MESRIYGLFEQLIQSPCFIAIVCQFIIILRFHLIKVFVYAIDKKLLLLYHYRVSKVGNGKANLFLLQILFCLYLIVTIYLQNCPPRQENYIPNGI